MKEHETALVAQPRSVVIVFCFDIDCMLVQSWIQCKSCLSQDLFEADYFCFLSVNESFCDLLMLLVRYMGCLPR